MTKIGVDREDHAQRGAKGSGVTRELTISRVTRPRQTKPDKRGLRTENGSMVCQFERFRFPAHGLMTCCLNTASVLLVMVFMLIMPVVVPPSVSNKVSCEDRRCIFLRSGLCCAELEIAAPL